ncbi:MAG: response regulator [Myxococcales bacterium]
MSIATSAAPEVAHEHTVLLVEADPDLQAQMAKVLRKQGLRVVATGSGSGALALVGEWAVSLILVSESLPGRSGVDLVRDLQRTRPGSRALVIVSHAEPRFVAAARAAGALGCVVRPLQAEQVAEWLAPDFGSSTPRPRLAPATATRSLTRRSSGLPLANSALPARGAVAE